MEFWYRYCPLAALPLYPEWILWILWLVTCDLWACDLLLYAVPSSSVNDGSPVGCEGGRRVSITAIIKSHYLEKPNRVLMRWVRGERCDCCIMRAPGRSRMWWEEWRLKTWSDTGPSYGTTKYSSCQNNSGNESISPELYTQHINIIYNYNFTPRNRFLSYWCRD